MMMSTDELLAYVRLHISEATVTMAAPGRYTMEVVHPVLIFTFKSNRERALGFTRELWDQTKSFEELRRLMERHAWKDEILGSTARKLTLGRSGWQETKWDLH